MSPRMKRLASVIIVGMLLFGAELAGRFFHPATGARAEALKQYGTPTPTRTRTPTVTATPDKMYFSLTNSNGVPPDDVLAEMAFFQGGGCYGCGPCDPNLQAIQPARELMIPLSLNVCWPQKNEQVNLTVYRPDGRTEGRWLKAEGDYLPLTYQALYDYPTGEYRLRLSGSQSVREFRITFYAPSAPRVMAVPDTPFLPKYSFQTASSRLVLDHFIPGEKVRLFAYQYSISNRGLKLLAWQEWTIRGDGRMPVSVDLPALTGSDTALFAAYGERSGEVHYWQVIGDNYITDPIRDRVLFCPGAKPSRLVPDFLNKTNLAVRVAHTDGTRLRIHQGPGFSSLTIALVPELTQINLTGGPRCADRSWFWEINWETVRGWVAEADQKDYLVEPLFPRLLPIATLRPVPRPMPLPTAP